MDIGDITSEIIGCAYDVMNELGCGFLESVYEKALTLPINQKGLSVKCQYPIAVQFRGVCVGDFYADLFVEDRVIVELKAVKGISPEHAAQAINYLQATGVEAGHIINFGNPNVEIKRLNRRKS